MTSLGIGSGDSVYGDYIELANIKLENETLKKENVTLCKRMSELRMQNEKLLEENEFLLNKALEDNNFSLKDMSFSSLNLQARSDVQEVVTQNKQLRVENKLLKVKVGHLEIQVAELSVKLEDVTDSLLDINKALQFGQLAFEFDKKVRKHFHRDPMFVNDAYLTSKNWKHFKKSLVKANQGNKWTSFLKKNGLNENHLAEVENLKGGRLASAHPNLITEELQEMIDEIPDRGRRSLLQDILDFVTLGY